MPTKGQKVTSKSTQTPDQGTQQLNQLNYEFQKFLQPFREEAIKALYSPSVLGPYGLKYSTPEEAKALTMFSGLTDISKLLEATQNQFESVAKPGIINTLTAAGFGRSGAVGESIARANEQAILPVTQEGRAAQGAVGNVLLGIGQNRIGSASNLINTPIPYAPGYTTTSTTKSGTTGGFNPLDIFSSGLSAAGILFPKGLQG